MVDSSLSDKEPPEHSQKGDQEPIQSQPHRKPDPPRDDTEATIHFRSVGFVIPKVPDTPFGAPIGDADAYVALPSESEATQNDFQWRIEFEGLGRERTVLGIDVMGDVIIGRGSGEAGAPDLDLDPYGAFEQGVSRHHALLRPTRNSLYLIDLNSTNGTWHNALRLGSGFTHALEHNDTISLGRLTFTVKIVNRPLPTQNLSSPDTDSAPPSSEEANLLSRVKEDVELPTPPFGSHLRTDDDAEENPQEDPPKNE